MRTSPGRVLELRRLATTEPALSDEALALACAGGDPTALGALFDRFHRPVARYVQRLVDNRADVEDLLQSTFLAVARGTSAYDKERGGVLTWLFGIATNVVRRHRRSTGRRRRLWSALVWSKPSEEGAGEDLAETRIQLRRAEEALRALPEDLRESFVLCELEGISARNAAAILGVSEVAVWKRVSKARRAIRAAVTGARS
jgi:RNA polymerase sigma-70 factor, ECF subfamily